MTLSTEPIFRTFFYTKWYLFVDDRSEPVFRSLKERCHGNQFYGTIGEPTFSRHAVHDCK